MSFEFDFTIEKLSQCINNPRLDIWYQPLVDILPEYGIVTVSRVAGWLSQTGHESMDFRTLQENLNYSASGLMRTFPRYFPNEAVANSYHRQPMKIANRAYANRMGNGPESSGDGWNFRGRGILQITGKDNYRRCSLALYGNEILLEQPDLLLEPDGSIRSACWYWNSRNINNDADNNDVRAMTLKINGGYHGLDDRTNRFNRCMDVLSS